MSYPNLLHRRDVLMSAAGLIAFAHQPAFSATSGRDPRLMVVFLRGGLDGLAAVSAPGDPAFVAARQFPVSPPQPQALPLDGFFALHGGMPKLAGCSAKSRR